MADRSASYGVATEHQCVPKDHISRHVGLIYQKRSKRRTGLISHSNQLELGFDFLSCVVIGCYRQKGHIFLLYNFAKCLLSVMIPKIRFGGLPKEDLSPDCPFYRGLSVITSHPLFSPIPIIQTGDTGPLF